MSSCSYSSSFLITSQYYFIGCSNVTSSYCNINERLFKIIFRLLCFSVLFVSLTFVRDLCILESTVNIVTTYHRLVQHTKYIRNNKRKYHDYHNSTGYNSLSSFVMKVHSFPPFCYPLTAYNHMIYKYQLYKCSNKTIIDYERL